jgi:tripartite-type tricarboxylate transporter receptor subunit TctC
MRILLASAAMAVALISTSARADDYPSRPIHVLTTSSAGGISDIFMRVLGEELHKKLGQPLVIDNRPGGAGNIAARACTEAQPDGYTICIINADTVVYNQYLFKKLPFEPAKLTPIVNLFHLIQVLVVNPDTGAKTVDQLIAASKAKPGTMNYLTASIPMVVYMENLKTEKGADWVRVPFRGGGEATNAVLAGTTPIALLGLGNVLPLIKAGKMNALALINNIRTPQLPNVPTLADTGYKGAPSTTWYGLFAPAGTPKALIDKLNTEIVAIASNKDSQEKYIIARSLVPALNTPAEFAATIKAEGVEAQEVVKASGLPLR